MSGADDGTSPADGSAGGPPPVAAEHGDLRIPPRPPLPAQSLSADPWSLSDPEPLPWAPPPEAVPQRRGVGGWALAFSIVGLLASFFVGWGFPFALVGIVAGGVALARPAESRPAAGWALALGILALVYSAGWLLWAARQMNLFG